MNLLLRCGVKDDFTFAQGSLIAISWLNLSPEIHGSHKSTKNGDINLPFLQLPKKLTRWREAGTQFSTS